MHEENHTLYLAVVDGRVHSIAEIENLTIAVAGTHPIRIGDFARVERGPSPSSTSSPPRGVNAVLLNIRSQPDGSTLDIANGLRQVLRDVKKELPPDLKTAYYYDQSLFVRESVGSVRDAILFGLILSVAIIYLFLKNWGITLTAIVVIPVTVLVTLVAMDIANFSFNLMTLGGIAAAIGLVIGRRHRRRRVHLFEDRHRPAAHRSDPDRNRGDLSPARGLHAHAGRRVHPARVPRGHHRRVLPRPGAHDGGGAAHLAGPRHHAHPVACRVVHPRP